VWEWVRAIIKDPKRAAAGLREIQARKDDTNRPLLDRMEIIDRQIEENEKARAKLLDLYLSEDFSKELLNERKNRLDTVLADLKKEKEDLSTHLVTVQVSEEQIRDIEEFCSNIRESLDLLDFDERRQFFDMVDMRGVLAIENGERIVNVSCHLGKQRLQVIQTSPSSSTGATATPPCACHRTHPSP
jgi:hypothetical protein